MDAKRRTAAEMREEMDCLVADDCGGLCEEAISALASLEALARRLAEAADWLMHLHTGVGKGGDTPPSLQEWADAMATADAVLAKAKEAGL
jgi:hypothetical protein